MIMNKTKPISSIKCLWSGIHSFRLENIRAEHERETGIDLDGSKESLLILTRWYIDKIEKRLKEENNEWRRR